MQKKPVAECQMTETALQQAGFDQKEIAVIRQQAESGGYSYQWLLSQLAKRFLAAGVVILLLLLGLIYTLCYGSEADCISYSLTCVIVGSIVYFFIPLKPAFKAFRWLRRQRRY